MRAAPDRKQLLLGGGHLAAVWALAFVQPLLDLLGNNPDFFVARGNTPGDILILAIGLTLLPPLVLLALEAVIARVSPLIYNWLHLILLGGIATFFWIETISRLIEGPTAVILLAAAGLGVLLAWAVHRFRFTRNLLDILIAAPVVILALFVFASPTSEVIFPGSVEATAAAKGGQDRPVVLMVLDELGTSDLMTDPDSIDAGRYPNLARLAREGTWYINHTTTDFFTPRAVPAILTGRLPPDDALPTARAQPENIFTLLGRDRPVHVMEPVTALCPESLCPESRAEGSRSERLQALFADLKYVEGRLVLPPGLAERLPDVSSNFGGFGEAAARGQARTERFFTKDFGTGPEPHEYRRFIEEIPDSRRGLTVMHVELPHQPWRFTSDGRLYNPSPLDHPWDPGPDRWLVDADGIATAQARMYTQTAFADSLVGELERTLRRKGLWEDAIVVVTADHGTSFEGDGVARRRVDPRAMGEVANPPLLIKYPGQEKGGPDTRHSTTLDILPTIARALGATGTYRFDGVPLQGSVPERPVTVKDVLNDDREVSVSVAEMARQRGAAIRRADRRLGSGPIYTLGPAPELIGRKVGPVPAKATGAVLDSPDLWDEVLPDQEPLPIDVTGTLGAGSETGVGTSTQPGMLVAIAVNGRVRGTARAFEFEDALRFGALVDPAALREGRNEIGIYAVRGRQLTPLGGGSE